jgi:hypothetical protein
MADHERVVPGDEGAESGLRRGRRELIGGPGPVGPPASDGAASVAPHLRVPTAEGRTG